MCAWLGVSRSGYYRWRDREPSVQSCRREHVRSAVVVAFKEFRQRYGAPRITVELNEAGIACSVNHIAKLMQEQGLKARNGKGYKYFPAPNAYSNLSGNLLNRDFRATGPDQKWVSDITYIKVARGHVYLAVIMDLFSRQIIGWAMGRNMTQSLIIQAFNMAVSRRKVKPGLILHSDRGVQYRSREYTLALVDAGITPSMSRKGNCWDNAVMESFFARLKVESLHAEKLKGYPEAYSTVFEYIEVFYNRIRRHSALNYRSPVDFEREYLDKCA